MSIYELVDSNMKSCLVSEIQEMNLDSCTNSELIALRSWADRVKQQADLLTLESEIVGYTYANLFALAPKIATEESKRGISLVKSLNFNKQ